MRRLSIMLVAACLALPALAQSGMTNVTASHLESDMSGALLTGKLCLTPVLGTNPNPVGFTANGGAQVAAGQVCYPVTGGALNISVPDTALAAPTGIGYKVALQTTSGYPLYNYTQAIYPNGATWSLDSWTPTQAANVTVPTVSYSAIAPSGDCGTAPAIWYTGPAEYTCVLRAWTLLPTSTATLPTAGAANQPLISTGAGTTYHAGAALAAVATSGNYSDLSGTPTIPAAISVTTTGTSGAATLASGVLNIPQYQGALTLTTTGSSGAATLSGSTLNIPQYAGGGSMVYPGGSGIPVVAGGAAWGTTVAAPAGAIVGTTDTQTLTNKSIVATQLTGALQAAQEPAHTGDATNSAASLAMTVKGINGTLLSGLATGILKNTTTTGVPSIATAGTDYQAPVTLTTTGSSGAATFSGNTLNIPQYTGLSNPMTTSGDMIGGGTSGAPTRIAAPTVGTVAYNLIEVPGSAPAFGLAGVGGRTVTTTTDTIAATDRGASVTYNSSSAVAVTLTSAATLGNNFDFVMGNLGAGAVTFTPGAGTINGGSTLAIAQNESCAINSQDNTNYVARCGFSTSGSGVTNNTFTNATTAIAANSCSASAVTVTLTGLTTASVPVIAPSTDVSGSTGWGATGGLVIVPWSSAANTMSYKICNQTAASITPAAVTWNAGAR